ncbi:MFS transporter [Sphingobacterium mizutaii NBRC 14946 = DSM 11724]|uniref:MFS transporter n=2 Tax=Sphingobacterium mizutaii TaxID=1010 RepID=A0ABQ0W0D5_9SPHI|nr:sugar porter family MFS transporter [Sphingobacterium mizutaii]GEM67373.1 MFS transporter [Sphingobacterium mizutaii NBRC 14946 = DSM 11724]SDL04067.1 MFS transporter, sugar porter (SP) family [Sphingobacterium mizutaii]SNV50572.1 Probable metabolite transport protein CsbC [Sphingobacterium mizutaii]
MSKIWKYVFIASLGGFLFGFETAVISGAEKIIQELWHLNSFWHGFTVSISLIGTIFGAIAAAKPAQKYGRKRVLQVVAVMYLLSAIGCGLSYNWYMFLFFRFLGGLSVGVSSVVGPLYISEIAPANLRGRMTGMFQIMIVSGIFIAFLTNYLFANFGDDAWRYMLGIMAIPSLAFLLLLNTIPFSPRWLALNNRKEEAKKVFDDLGQTYEETLQAEIGTSEKVPLFQAKYRKPIIYAVLLAVFNQFTGINAILYYAPRIFEMAGFSRDLAFLQPIFIGGTNLLFTLIGMSIIDKYGRKKLLLSGAVGMFIFLVLTAFGLKGGASEFLLFYIIGFIASFALSQGAVIWVFISEIFPNAVRAQGTSLGSTTHWVMAALISWVFPIVVENFASGGFYIFLFYAIMVVVSFFFVMRMPETKGKSLEQIQEELN